MRQEFEKILGKTAASFQLEEAEPEGESTKIHSSSPPRDICSHHQHLVDVIDSPFHSKFFSFVLHNSSSCFQALQKICLASHIRGMADLLDANPIQHLEVALLGSPAAHVIDLLSGGWLQIKLVPMTTLI